MLHEFDRRFWIGGSDIDRFVMANNQNTKGWQKWWAEKCGLAEPEPFVTAAMRTGTDLEHSILKTWNPDIEWDGQIIYEPLMLRINYDGWHDGYVFEVKCHRMGNDWSWDRYRGQLIVQGWTYQTMAEKLGLPPFKGIYVLEYPFTPEEECTIHESSVVESGDVPIDKDRIHPIEIPYKRKQFNGVKSHLRPLARQLKRIAPERSNEMAVVWSYKLFKADAEKVYSDLENIEEKTPQNVVDYAAEHPDSELYKCFTWDDTKAANEWRKAEARQVMRTLVYQDDEKEDVPVIRVLQKTEESYKPVKEIVRNKDEYKELLQRAKAELKAFRERYKALTELEEILELIDEL